MSRNIISAETVAQLEGDLYKSAIDYNMQWSLWKRQQDYARKMAEKEAGPGARNTVDRLVDEGAEIATGAADAFRTERDALAADDKTVKDMDITKVATAWAAENGYTADSPQFTVFIETMRILKNNPHQGTDTAYKTAIERLYSGEKGWDKWGPAALDAGMHNIHTSLTAALSDYKEQQAGDFQPTFAQVQQLQGKSEEEQRRLIEKWMREGTGGSGAPRATITAPSIRAPQSQGGLGFG